MNAIKHQRNLYFIFMEVCVNKHYTCTECECEFEFNPNKPGKKNMCTDCSNDDVTRYTGNMIYDHKTGADIQINSDPELTKYIINSTKLRNKASNLGNNLKANSGKVRSNGLVYAAGGRSRRRD
jgi:hypothetical protein